MPPIVPPVPSASPARLRAGGEKRDIVLPSYVIPLAVAAVVVAAIIALPKFLSRGVESSSPPSKTTARAVAPGPDGKPANSAGSRSAKANSSPSRDTLKTSAARPAAKESSQPAAAAPSPTAMRTETKPALDASKTSAASSAASGSASEKGEVLDQILPDIPGKALATISGKVRVAVRAHVDAAGNVSSAEFESPGPSQYFADAALKAVRRWEFSPPEAAGHSVPSEWLVRFEFTPAGVKAFPNKITP